MNSPSSMTRAAKRQALRSHARRERHIILHSLSIFTTRPRVVKINIREIRMRRGRARRSYIGSLATAACNEGTGGYAVFSLLLFRYIIADKIPAENKVPRFLQSGTFIYAEVNSTRRRLFEIFN